MAEDRDQLFEKALARQLRADAVESQCLDPETLAAFYERMLSPDELMEVKTHIASCSRCQEVMTQLAATQEVNQIVEEPELVRASAPAGRRANDAASENLLKLSPPKSSPMRRWVVPVGAIAAALLLVFGVNEFRKVSKPATETQVAQNRTESSNRRESADSNGLVKPQQQAQQNEIEQELRDLHTPTLSASSANSDLDRSKEKDAEKKTATLTRPEFRQYSPAVRAKQAPGPSAAASQAQAADAIQQAKPGAVGGVTQQVEVNAPALKVETEQTRVPAASATPAAPPPPPAPQAEAAATGSQAGNSLTADKSAVFRAVRELGLGRRIATPDGKKIWSLGPGGQIAYSKDGGNTWLAQTSGVSAALTSGFAPSDKVCWIVGAAGTLVRTTDGGKHWQILQTPITGDLGGVQATDAQHASIWDAANRLRYQTTDGGATWTQVAKE